MTKSYNNNKLTVVSVEVGLGGKVFAARSIKGDEPLPFQGKYAYPCPSHVKNIRRDVIFFGADLQPVN